MNKLYKKQIVSKIDSAISKANAIGDLKNPGLKGKFREVLIRDLFEPLLPSDIGVGNGVILTYNDKQSKEQDIIIYDKQILPPVLIEKKSGLFPIESVLFTIEIKSEINAGELSKSIKSAIDLSSLEYVTGDYNGDVPITKKEILRSIPTIFAFSSDLKSDKVSELNRYHRINNDICKSFKINYPAIKCICILGKVCWVYNNGKWVSIDADDDHMEVVSFLSLIMHTYKMISKSRGEPRLGNYLLEFPK